MYEMVGLVYEMTNCTLKYAIIAQICTLQHAIWYFYVDFCSIPATSETVISETAVSQLQRCNAIPPSQYHFFMAVKFQDLLMVGNYLQHTRLEKFHFLLQTT